MTRRAGRHIYSTPQWRNTRKAKLGTLCELNHEGCTRIAEEVHHIVSIGDGGALFELDNLQAVCKHCHSIETRREQLSRLKEN